MQTIKSAVQAQTVISYTSILKDGAHSDLVAHCGSLSILALPTATVRNNVLCIEVAKAFISRKKLEITATMGMGHHRLMVI